MPFCKHDVESVKCYVRKLTKGYSIEVSWINYVGFIYVP